MSAPEKRYLVSIGSFASEKSALDRLEAARRSGFSGEIIDDANNPTVNLVAAIMCIGEATKHIGEILSKQIEGLIEQVSAISEKIEARQTEPAQSAPAQSAPAQAELSNEKLKAFGAKLTSKRNILGLSRAEVASDIGVCINTVKNWEHGMSAPKTKYIKDICIAYGVKMDDVVGLM